MYILRWEIWRFGGFWLFVSLHCPFQILTTLLSIAVAMASLRLISDVVFPFTSILAQRYSKLSTISNYSPSNSLTASFSHFSLSINLVLFTFRCYSFLSLCSFTDLKSFSNPVGAVANSVVSSAYRRSLICVPCIDGSSYSSFLSSIYPSFSHFTLCIKAKKMWWFYTSLPYAFGYVSPFWCSTF